MSSVAGRRVDVDERGAGRPRRRGPRRSRSRRSRRRRLPCGPSPIVASVVVALPLAGQLGLAGQRDRAVVLRGRVDLLDGRARRERAEDPRRRPLAGRGPERRDQLRGRRRVVAAAQRVRLLLVDEQRLDGSAAASRSASPPSASSRPSSTRSRCAGSRSSAMNGFAPRGPESALADLPGSRLAPSAARAARRSTAPPSRGGRDPQHGQRRDGRGDQTGTSHPASRRSLPTTRNLNRSAVCSRGRRRAGRPGRRAGRRRRSCRSTTRRRPRRSCRRARRATARGPR